MPPKEHTKNRRQEDETFFRMRPRMHSNLFEAHYILSIERNAMQHTFSDEDDDADDDFEIHVETENISLMCTRTMPFSRI